MQSNLNIFVMIADLKRLYFQAGVTNKPTVFLFTDTQVVEEIFLEDINNILSSGEVPNLYKVRNWLLLVLKNEKNDTFRTLVLCCHWQLALNRIKPHHLITAVSNGLNFSLVPFSRQTSVALRSRKSLKRFAMVWQKTPRKTASRKQQTPCSATWSTASGTTSTLLCAWVPSAIHSGYCWTLSCFSRVSWLLRKNAGAVFLMGVLLLRVGRWWNVKCCDFFRNRIRQYPAFVNCTTIDLFTEWPHDALLEVAEKYLEGLDLGSAEDVRCCCLFTRVLNVFFSYATTDDHWNLQAMDLLASILIHVKSRCLVLSLFAVSHLLFVMLFPSCSAANVCSCSCLKLSVCFVSQLMRSLRGECFRRSRRTLRKSSWPCTGRWWRHQRRCCSNWKDTTTSHRPTTWN